ncbi:MAG: hypothetical protein JNK87_42965 [Bryobacterales bacterium]|nr:hypothetical protein [Bryobacterales bacterium]
MTPRLTAWQKEIEALGGTPVVLVPVTTTPENTLTIPAAFPGRAVVARLLGDEAFVVQLLRAHALTVTLSEAGQRYSFVLLNQARAADWEGDPEGLLGHELGHLWLQALGYRSPAASAGDPCLATFAGDIVQHILIRDELRRRGIGYDAFWTRLQTAWLAGPPVALPADRCGRLQLLAAWMDAALGYTDAEWPARGRYLQHLRAQYPSLAPYADTLAGKLGDRVLWDRSLYAWALGRVLNVLSSIE